jgi:clan AA aspartic protease
MGLIRTEIQLLSTEDVLLARRGRLPEDQIKRAKVTALVDSGAYMLAINDQIKTQLDLSVLDNQIAELTDGSKVKLEIVGPVEVRFENRSTSVRAMVLPGDAEVLLGSITMEDMDVLIDPKRQQLIVNPENPYFAKKPLK